MKGTEEVKTISSLDQQKEEVIKEEVKPSTKRKPKFQKAVRGGIVALSLSTFDSPPKNEPKPVIEPIVINLKPPEPEKPPKINIKEVPLSSSIG